MRGRKTDIDVRGRKQTSLCTSDLDVWTSGVRACSSGNGRIAF